MDFKREQNFNYIKIAGEITKNAELNYTTEGKSILEFKITHEYKKKTKHGAWQNEKIPLDVTYYNEKCKIILPAITKGQLIIIFGRLRQKHLNQEEKTKTQNKTTYIKTFYGNQALPNSEKIKNNAWPYSLWTEKELSKNTNEIKIMGKVTKNPKPTYITEKDQVLKFNIINKHSEITIGDKWKNTTSSFNIILFNKKWKEIIPGITKGQEIIITGYLRQEDTYLKNPNTKIHIDAYDIVLPKSIPNELVL